MNVIHISRITPVTKTLNDYWMACTIHGVEVVAEGATQEECRRNFEQELMYVESIIPTTIRAVG